MAKPTRETDTPSFSLTEITLKIQRVKHLFISIVRVVLLYEDCVLLGVGMMRNCAIFCPEIFVQQFKKSS